MPGSSFQAAGVIATPLRRMSAEGRLYVSCTLTVPRTVTGGRWGRADHITLLLPKGLLSAGLSRGRWVHIAGRVITYTGYSPLGILEGKWGVLVSRIIPLPPLQTSRPKRSAAQ